jgi:hypothetical protein
MLPTDVHGHARDVQRAFGHVGMTSRSHADRSDRVSNIEHEQRQTPLDHWIFACVLRSPACRHANTTDDVSLKPRDPPLQPDELANTSR